MQCPAVCFGVSFGFIWLWAAHLLLCQVVHLFCWRIGMGHLALELAKLWVALVLKWRPLGELLLINVSWDQEFCSGSKTWTWVFHLWGSGLTLWYSIKTAQVTQHRRQSSKTWWNQHSTAQNTQRNTHQSHLIFLGRSLDLLWTVRGQLSVRSGLTPAYTCSQRPQLPQKSTVWNCGDLIHCTCGFRR